jgi:excisionase family DNA binding protein
MIPKLLTVEDISVLLGIGKTTAYKLIREMNYAKIGRRILVSEDEISNYIKTHSTDHSENESS